MSSGEAFGSPEKIPTRSLNKNEAGYVGPLVLVYRENPFLTTYARDLANMVTARGGEVEVHTFPAGTYPEVIRDWHTKNAGLFAGKRVLTDKTCSSIFPDAREASSGLDAMFDQAMWQTIAGADARFDAVSGGSYSMRRREVTQEDITSYTQGITNLFKTFFESDVYKNAPPKTLVILEERMSDHFPVVNRSAKEDSLAVVSVRDAIVAAGFPEEQIRIVSSVGDLMQGNVLGTESNDWIIADRHALSGKARNDISDEELQKKYFGLRRIGENSFGSDGFVPQPEHFKENKATHTAATIIQLPLGNAMENARHFGLLNMPKEKLDALIEARITEKL